MWKWFLLVAIVCGVESQRRVITDADVALAESIRLERNGYLRSSYSGGGSRDDTVQEGDMDLTAAQYTDLYTPSNRTKRHELGEQTWGAVPWTNGIVPYVVDQSFTAEHRRGLRTAMETIERWSCVRFREKTWNDVNYVNIQNHRSRCSSMVGMIGGEQHLYLSVGTSSGKNSCRYIHTYIHELLHALGLVHEHQLPTRTGYLKQWLVNAEVREQHNFQPYSQAAMVDYRQEYDLDSIMHYPSKGFTMNDGKTMTTGQPFQDRFFGLGYFNELSFGDVKSVNMFYKCAAHCPRCYRAGRNAIQLKDCQCITPDEYSGKTCRDNDGAEACEAKLVKGDCFKFRESSGKGCAKTCGYCNVFKFGEKARVEDRRCDDYHFDPSKCREFKNKGHCESHSKWMSMNCRRTCGKCFGAVCPNVLRNEYMCYWSNTLCSDPDAHRQSVYKASCKSNCGLCGKREEGNCNNVGRDIDCEKWAGEDLCEEDSVWMFQECPKTCNRCNFNKGMCQNFHPDEQECLRLASINYCDSPSHKDFMETKCSKACDTCHRASAACEDTDPNGVCEKFSVFGYCNNPLKEKFMRQNCKWTCGFC